MYETRLLIGGELIAGMGAPLAIENPYTTETIVTVNSASSEQVAAEGGKDAFIVCADVTPQLEVAARGGAWAAFLKAGQVCTSAERFYVAEEIFDDYAAAFVEHTRGLVLGDPFEVSTDIGPMASEPQRAKVIAQLDAARSARRRGPRRRPPTSRTRSAACASCAPARSGSTTR
jgi:acyl-CoA reductase-like NAD-dependent aldehyde dehydrogenase